jgi:hypothetical protein
MQVQKRGMAHRFVVERISVSDLPGFSRRSSSSDRTGSFVRAGTTPSPSSSFASFASRFTRCVAAAGDPERRRGAPGEPMRFRGVPPPPLASCSACGSSGATSSAW